MKWGSPYFDCGMGLVTGTGFLGRLGLEGLLELPFFFPPGEEGVVVEVLAR